jgi:hypothetical protein
MDSNGVTPTNIILIKVLVTISNRKTPKAGVRQIAEEAQINQTKVVPNNSIQSAWSGDETDRFFEFIELLRSVDPHGKLAKLNATTMNDNNGGRIEL